MKRVVVLVLVAFVLMWGGVLLELGRPAPSPRTRASTAEALEGGDSVAEETGEPAAAAPVEALATNHVQALARGEHIAPDAPEPGGPPGRAEALAPAAKPGASARSAANAARTAGEATEDELLGEQGVGATSPEFVQLETDYVGEPRDGVWAREEEQRIAALISAHPVSQKLVMLNCQDSVCRIMLATKTKDAFQQLLSVPGLMQATGLSPQSPYSLQSGQLSVYYRRPAPTTAAASKTGR